MKGASGSRAKRPGRRPPLAMKSEAESMKKKYHRKIQELEAKNAWNMDAQKGKKRRIFNLNLNKSEKYKLVWNSDMAPGIRGGVGLSQGSISVKGEAEIKARARRMPLSSRLY